MRLGNLTGCVIHSYRTFMRFSDFEMNNGTEANSISEVGDRSGHTREPGTPTSTTQTCGGMACAAVLVYDQ